MKEQEQSEFCCQKIKDATFKEFKECMKNICRFYCERCKCLAKSKKTDNVCKNCDGKDADDALKHNSLPIWVDDQKQQHFELPDELLGMYDAKKC